MTIDGQERCVARAPAAPDRVDALPVRVGLLVEIQLRFIERRIPLTIFVAEGRSDLLATSLIGGQAQIPGLFDEEVGLTDRFI